MKCITSTPLAGSAAVARNTPPNQTNITITAMAGEFPDQAETAELEDKDDGVEFDIRWEEKD